MQADRNLDNRILVNTVPDDAITVPVDRYVIFVHLDAEAALADDHVWVKAFQAKQVDRLVGPFLGKSVQPDHRTDV